MSIVGARRVRILAGLILLALGAGTAKGEDKGLSIEIKLDGNSVYGTVRNDSDKEITAILVFGHWEFTTVLYLDGARWHEAPFRELYRHGLGYAAKERLAPGERLLSSTPDLRKAGCTFRIDLAMYKLPKDLSRVTKIRIVTNDLWSNIIDFKKLEKPTSDERSIDLSDPEKRVKE